MFDRAKLRQSVRELDDNALTEAHAAIVALLGRMDANRIDAARTARAEGRLETAVGVGGAAVVAAGLVGLSVFTFGLTGIAAAGVLAAKATHACGAGKALEDAGRMAERGMQPAKDGAYLAHYEELEFRKESLEDELASRRRENQRQLADRQRAQVQRNAWGKLIDDSRA